MGPNGPAKVGGAAAGLVTARAADIPFARRRAERQPVGAVLLEDLPRTAVELMGTGSDQSSAEVRWTAPDGSRRAGRTMVGTGRSGLSTAQ